MKCSEHVTTLYVVSSSLGSVEACLDCCWIRVPPGKWRARKREDGIEGRWLDQMRVALGKGPVGPGLGIGSVAEK